MKKIEDNNTLVRRPGKPRGPPGTAASKQALKYVGTCQRRLRTTTPWRAAAPAPPLPLPRDSGLQAGAARAWAAGKAAPLLARSRLASAQRAPLAQVRVLRPSICCPVRSHTARRIV